MTFQFPYTHILNLKEKEKGQAQLEFGLIERRRDVLLKEHDTFIEKKEQYLQQLEAAKGRIAIADIQQRQEYLAYLEHIIAKLAEQLSVLDHELEGKKTELLHKQKEEKTWNHLRNKSFEKYSQKQKKIEQDLMDEMAAVRHFHQRLSI
jgi:flagellar protein FliJ